MHSRRGTPPPRPSLASREAPRDRRCLARFGRIGGAALRGGDAVAFAGRLSARQTHRFRTRRRRSRVHPSRRCTSGYEPHASRRRDIARLCSFEHGKPGANGRSGITPSANAKPSRPSKSGELPFLCMRNEAEAQRTIANAPAYRSPSQHAVLQTANHLQPRTRAVIAIRRPHDGAPYCRKRCDFPA